MSMAPAVNLDASSGTRVNSARLDLGRDACIGFSCCGRRKARTKVDRSVSVACDSEMPTGIEGKYLKLGKRNAEAEEAEAGVVVGKDELVRRALLNGYCGYRLAGYSLDISNVPKKGKERTSAYCPPRPIRRFSPRVSSPQLSFCPSSSMRLVQSLCPVQMRSCCV